MSELYEQYTELLNDDVKHHIATTFLQFMSTFLKQMIAITDRTELDDSTKMELVQSEVDSITSAMHTLLETHVSDEVMHN